MDINITITKIKTLANSDHRYALLAKYVINNSQKIVNCRIADFAEKTFSSPATVSRFVRFLGLSGYNELQHILKYYLQSIAGDYISYVKTEGQDDHLELFFKNSTQSLRDTHDIVDVKKLEQVILYLTKSSEVILLAGQASYVPCYDLAEKLIRLGLNVKFSNNTYIQHSYCQLSTKNSLIIAVSYSGSNDEVINNLKIAKKNHSHIVTVTKKSKNEVSDYGDIALHILSNESIERHISLTSHLALIYLFDVFFISILQLNKPKYLANLRKTRLR